jgi:activator of 2-hydroxyglutaryl-CoA dehydratase
VDSSALLAFLLGEENADGSGRLPLPDGRQMTVLIGVDLGKVTTSLAWASMEPDGSLGAIGATSERHYGDPLGSFLRLYREIGGGDVAGIVATGVYSSRLGEPVLSGLPEEIAQEYATESLFPDAGPLNVVRIGGSGYSVLTRDERGRFVFEKNERCSAGTGETMERLCSRLGCTLAEAVALAETSADGVAVTARCSVFAKSELTHFANQGEPHGRLFRGYFTSVAKNVHALYDKVKVDGPVVLIGHGASIGPLVDAFTLLAARPVEVAPQADVFEALGALHYAAQHRQTPAAVWPLDPEELVRHVDKRVRSLRPAHEMGGSVTYLAEPRGARDSRAGGLPPESVPAVLGLDLGSTGSKAALIEAQGGTVIVDVYRRTDGNPIEAAKALVAQILEATRSWPWGSPAPGAMPRPPCSGRHTPTWARASACRTRSWPTPRRPCASTRTRAAASLSSRSEGRTPSSST